jgi:hypothetical protein
MANVQHKDRKVESEAPSIFNSSLITPFTDSIQLKADASNGMQVNQTSITEPHSGINEQVPSYSYSFDSMNVFDGSSKIHLKPSMTPNNHSFSAADSFDLATTGQAQSLPYQDILERSFNTKFSDVQAYLGGDEARAGLSHLGAVAATHGHSIAFRESNPSLGLVAHETAHIVQQQNGGNTIQRRADGISSPTDPAELQADAVAMAIVNGLPVPNVGAIGNEIHRAVETSGGSWSTPTYTAQAAGTGVTGDSVGCEIEVHFTPNELVEAPANGIGLVQTVKSMKSSTPGGARDTFAPPSDPGKALVTMGAGTTDPGRGVDRMVYPPDASGPGGNRAVPNTNPMYGVYNPPGGVAIGLNNQTPSVGTTQFGSHVKKADGTFEAPVDAILSDSPGRALESDGQTFEQTFEVAALVMSGPLANSYLGTVAWGYQSGSDGVSTLTPTPIVVVEQGNPSAMFNAAAQTWNDAILPDRATPGTTYDTVNLPIDNARRPSEMSSPEILTKLSTIDAEIAGLAGADQSRKQLEKRALENEAHSRTMSVSVDVKSTEDWTGADEVYVRLTGNGTQVTSDQHSLNDGESFTFSIPLGAALPGTGGFQIEVFDSDWPDGDDILVSMEMASPFSPVVNTATMDDASYNVQASLA